MKLKEYKELLLRDPEVAAAYKELEPKIEFAEEVIQLRKRRGWTQAQLARRIGTKQANISRLENAVDNPTMETMIKIAEAFDGSLDVSIVLPSSKIDIDRADLGPGL